MKNTDFKKEKILTSGALMTLALVFFANPTVRLFDILPDFVACLIIAKALRYPADRAPFFSEARSAFIKLGIVSLMKIPAFFILISVRSTNVSDFDISALLTFSFAVIEALYFTSAISNLFSALFYLGERSNERVLLAPFKTSANEYSKRTMKPETLKLLTLAFTYFKLAAGSLPEMLLLSSTTDYGSHVGQGAGALLYPYVLLALLVFTVVFGVIFAKSFNSYIKAIRADGCFYPTLDSLVRDEARIELDKRIEKRNMRSSLDLYVIAILFIFTLRIDTLQEINLIPLCVFAPLSLYALIRLWHSPRPILPAIITGSLFFISSLIYQITEFSFLDKYGYDLMVTDMNVRMSYIPTIITSLVTFITFSAFMACISLGLIKFAARRVLTPDLEGADRIRMDRYRSIRRRAIIWCAIGIFTMLTLCLNVLFKFFPSTDAVLSGDGSYKLITTTLIPWFGTLVFIVSLILLGYTIYLISSMKDDIDTYVK